MTIKEIIREIPDDPRALELEEEQHELEKAAAKRARERVEAQLLKLTEKKQEGTGKVAGQMARHGIAALMEYIDDWMEKTTIESQKKGRGKTGKSTECLLLPDFLAMKEKGILLDFVSSSLGSCFNGINMGKALTSTAFDIARRAEHALMLEAAREHDKALPKTIKQAADRKGDERRKQNTIRFMVNVNQVDWESWGKKKQSEFGHLFLRMVVNSDLGYFYIDKKREGKQTIDVLALTKQADAWMCKGEQKLLDTATLYEPMIVPPTPWAPGISSGAGYLTSSQMPLLLVKKKGRKYLKTLEALQDPRMDTFYKGLNAAQTTGWKIRKPILAHLNAMLDAQNDMGLLPPLKEIETHPIPATADKAKALLKGWNTKKGNRAAWIKENLSEEDQQIVNAYLAWNNHKELTYATNAKMPGQRVGLLRDIATAEHLQDFESIYFPYQVDFRGRIYAATNGGLSPQGADYVKALLEFDKGMALGATGWHFLLWHTANVWGEDKLAHDDRVQWTDENMDLIQAWADNPMDTSIVEPKTRKHWTEADKPFQFLACCFELNEALKLENPEDYVSHMPIAMDGSCSGLQHLGMATRCEDTAWAVNIKDVEYSNTPSDIYQDVADKVAERLHDIANGGECKEAWWKGQAKKWIAWEAVWKNGKLSRSVTKRPVMTYSYGATAYGFSEQVLEDTLEPAFEEAKEKGDTSFPWPTLSARRQAANLMKTLIWDAVTDTVKRPAQIMEWMQSVAKLTHKDAPLTWTTPLGFPTEQDNPKRVSESADFTMKDGTRVRNSYNQDLPEQDMEARVNGIAPHVVHGLDSSHLLMTVAAAMDEGIEHFALIHDCFGTHAANTDKLNHIVKVQMVKLYKGDYFEELRQQLIPQVRPELLDQMPELPARGDLDINMVLRAEFAFA